MSAAYWLFGVQRLCSQKCRRINARGLHFPPPSGVAGHQLAFVVGGSVPQPAQQGVSHPLHGDLCGGVDPRAVVEHREGDGQVARRVDQRCVPHHRWTPGPGQGGGGGLGGNLLFGPS